MSAWRPSLGAIPEGGGTRVRVWAPDAGSVELVVERGRDVGARHRLASVPGGCFEARIPGLGSGDRYRFSLDSGPPWPDPASRFQPGGVHGPSEIVDPGAFRWSDHDWSGVALDRLVLYELHVGAFTPEGTFRAAARRLPELRDLGVTAVELMPVADFPGDRNWGYDGAALFAPARCYGAPDDLRGLVDAAHGLGLAVHLDVVYNHFGPDGAYAGAFSRRFFSPRHRSPWGAGINLDGPDSDAVRSFLVENALHWIHEYHLDGLRLDATHAMVDEGPTHFLAELSERVRASLEGDPEAAPGSGDVERTRANRGGRSVLLVAEDARNLAHTVAPVSEDGWGMDAVWSDDFHHTLRVHLAGDRDGYFADFAGTTEEIAVTLRQGWLYTGQRSAYAGAPRGTDPTGVALRRFVVCTQNHDQVGNRAFGERLHHQIPLASYHAATALHLLAPQTPLLFMGQEWAATSRFLFFTDHGPEIGPQVTRGRRAEFRRFRAFADPETREWIPDPQAWETFEESRIRWEERECEPHAGTLRLFTDLLAMRRDEEALLGAEACDAGALDPGTLWLRRGGERGPALCVVARLSGSGTVRLGADALPPDPSRWTQAWTSEHSSYVAAPCPARPEQAGGCLQVSFERPGAVVLRRSGA